MLNTFGILSPAAAIIVLVIVLVIFGPGKLPEIGRVLGKGFNEFRSATRDVAEPMEERQESAASQARDQER